MITLTFIRFAFLLLLPFQSRGRGRENTSPLPFSWLQSKSSDGHSGCPRQKASRIYLIQNKPHVSAYCRSCFSNKWLMKRLQEKKRSYKTAIMHHVIQVRLISLVRKLCKRQINNMGSSLPFSYQNQLQFPFFPECPSLCAKKWNYRQMKEVLTSSFPFLASLTCFSPTAKPREEPLSPLCSIIMCSLWLVWPSEVCLEEKWKRFCRFCAFLMKWNLRYHENQTSTQR